MHTGNQLDMHGRRSKPSAELTSLIDRGLLPEDASLAAEAPAFTDNPFQLGIASGEPHPDGFVIWTRLAPDPLAEDGSGGMPNRNVPVRWEVAEDEHFRKIVKQGTATALAELGHSVHVEIHGLKAGKILLVQIQSRSGDQPDRPDENRASPICRSKRNVVFPCIMPSLVSRLFYCLSAHGRRSPRRCVFPWRLYLRIPYKRKQPLPGRQAVQCSQCKDGHPQPIPAAVLPFQDRS